MNSGVQIRQMRREQSLSQAELGRRAHLRQTLVSDIERGIRQPDARECAALARALGVDPSVLDGDLLPKDNRPAVAASTELTVSSVFIEFAIAAKLPLDEAMWLARVPIHFDSRAGWENFYQWLKECPQDT